MGLRAEDHALSLISRLSSCRFFRTLLNMCSCRYSVFGLLLLAVPVLVSAKSKKAVSAKGKPNVLFIIADDLRDYVGWMGGILR